MSEELQTAVISGEEQTDSQATPPVEEPSVTQVEFTQEQIEEMVNGDDDEQRQLAMDILEGKEIPLDKLQPKEEVEVKEGEEGKEVEVTPPVEGETPPVETLPAVDKTYYNFEYKGEKSTIEDPDGFLGRGSVDGIKKQNANQIRYIAEIRNEKDSVGQKLDDEMRKCVDLESKLELAAKTPPAPVAVAPVTPPATPPQEFKLPDAPVRPDIPKDPTLWTEDQATAFTKFQDDMVNYSSEIGKVAITRSQQPPAQMPQEWQDRFEAQQKELDEAKLFIQGQKADIGLAEREKVEEDYWKNIETFRNLHKGQYRQNDIHVEDLHKSVITFMDEVADANNIRLPHGATPEVEGQYRTDRSAIVGRYLNGDQNVVNRTQHVEPPTGYKEYFEVAEVMTDHSRLIAEGKLGNNATLHDAFVFRMDQNGVFEKGINQISSEAQAKGAEGMLNAMQGHYKNDAVTVPNNATQTQPSGSEGLSQNEMQELMTADARTLQMWKSKEPEKYKKREQLLASMNI